MFTPAGLGSVKFPETGKLLFHFATVPLVMGIDNSRQKSGCPELLIYRSTVTSPEKFAGVGRAAILPPALIAVDFTVRLPAPDPSASNNAVPEVSVSTPDRLIVPLLLTPEGLLMLMLLTLNVPVMDCALTVPLSTSVPLLLLNVPEFERFPAIFHVEGAVTVPVMLTLLKLGVVPVNEVVTVSGNMEF